MQALQAERFRGDDPQSPGDLVAGQYFAYDYDPTRRVQKLIRAGNAAVIDCKGDCERRKSSVTMTVERSAMPGKMVFSMFRDVV